jgi:DNA (cytosine-5)-methyltransferase 1
MAAMASSRFTFIDLFAGIGGMRLAFQSAGGQCVFSSEWDEFACQTYEANFGERPRGDITKISPFQIPQHDVLVAGFPCQPFSIAGVSKNNSLGNGHGFSHATQGTLFFEIARILAESRPRAFLLENVKNLISHDHGRTFEVIKKTLSKELGYSIHYQVIDASRRVPQHRERIYIVGFREPVEFEFPAFDDARQHLFEVMEEDVDDRYWLTEHLWNYLKDYAAKHQLKGNGFGYGLVANPWGVTRTLSARYYKDGSEILIPTLKGTPRRLTPRECARLMGFPDTFKIPVSDTQAYKQFGNSVAVPIVAEVAEAIANTLNGKSTADAYVHGRFRVTVMNGNSNGQNGHSKHQGKLLEAPTRMVSRKPAVVPVATIDRPISHSVSRNDAAPDARKPGSSRLPNRDGKVSNSARARRR